MRIAIWKRLRMLLELDYMREIEITKEKASIVGMYNFDHKQDMIKVSIIIPVYNVESYLAECLESAINQSLKEIEIICVNDGSTDNSLNILKSYADIDKRVKIIDKKNTGYGNTMNLGIDMATGVYVGIIESDDYVSFEMYEKLYNLAVENALDWIKADFNRFTVNDGQVLKEYNNVAKKKEYYNKIFCPKDLPYSFRFIMNTWSGIYKREFLVNNKIRHQETPGASYQDNGFWFQTMIYAKRAYISNECFYMNRRDNPNSSVFSKEKVDCIFDEYKYISDILNRDLNLKELFKGELVLKKYHNYLYNYKRISNEHRLYFINKAAKEFKDSIVNNEFDADLFYPYELEEFNWISSNPEEYYNHHNDNNPKVSIIIPVYNGAKYLDCCLKSVLNQTMQDFEIICIDDGSSDCTLDLLEEYKKSDPRIKVFTQSNKGGGAARNLGLDNAVGEYLLFLDADDFFDEKLVELAYLKASSQHADVCVFKAYIYDDLSGDKWPEQSSLVKSNLPNKSSFTPTEVNDLFGTFKTWPWNKIFRRHFIESCNIRFQETFRTNDAFFVFVSLYKAKLITTIDKELVFYRINNNSSCQSTNSLYPTDFSKAILKLQEELDYSHLQHEMKKSFINFAISSCIYNLNSQSDGDAYEQVYNCIKCNILPSLEFELIDNTWIDSGNISSYKECVKILDQSMPEYLLRKVKYYREESLIDKKTITSQKTEIAKLKTECSNAKKRTYDPAGYISEDMVKELLRIKDENTRYQMELVQTRTSFSCRLGLAITYIPRKIRDFIIRK